MRRTAPLSALDGGPDEASQDRRDFCERVRRRRVGGGLQLAVGEQSPDPGADGGEECATSSSLGGSAG